MAFFGLFDKKDKKDESKSKDSSYFLDQDSAKTFGDIDYMRTPKSVRKTFPTVNGVKGADIVGVFSANERMEISNAKETDNNQSSEPISSSTIEPKKIDNRVDSSMDIFLKMAKDINKK